PDRVTLLPQHAGLAVTFSSLQAAIANTTTTSANPSSTPARRSRGPVANGSRAESQCSSVFRRRRAPNENRIQSERQAGVDFDRRPGDAAALRAARRPRAARATLWLWPGSVRGLHRPSRWESGALMPGAGVRGG